MRSAAGARQRAAARADRLRLLDGDDGARRTRARPVGRVPSGAGAANTGMTIGIASAVVGVAVLLAWIPLRNRPGIGTVANVIVIAVTVDAGMAILTTPTSLPVRVAMMVGAVVLNAISTVLYIGAGLGPGPRDGLMTGPGGPHRPVGAAGPDLDRGHGADRRLAARRHRRRRHRFVRIRHRPTSPALRPDHPEAGVGPQRLGFRRHRQRFGRGKSREAQPNTPKSLTRARRRCGGCRRCSRPACWSIRRRLLGRLAAQGTIWSRRVASGNDRA